MDSEPLLRPTSATVAGVVDHRGRPVSAAESGGWPAALFIIGVEVAERVAYYGVSLNLITYLTGPLGESTADAAAALNAWDAVASMLPLLGAFVADSLTGRYRMIVSASLLYVLDNVGWGLGFGIPCITMMIALVVFLLGTKTYRFYHLEGKGTFNRIGKTLIMLARRQSWNSSYPTTSVEAEEFLPDENQSEFSHDSRNSYPVKKDGHVQSAQVDEAKGLLRLLPIWATCLIYGVVIAQSSTFFTKQSSTMDRRIGPNFQVPPAALQSIIAGTIFAFIPIYDCVLVPMAKRFSSVPSGITTLQRIGIGMFLSVIAIAVAALVEMKRLKTAKDSGLVDLPTAVIPMSLWWLVPQYALYGVSEALTTVGLQEFFYDQMPDALRSLGLALFLSIFGVGSFISSVIISAIDGMTSRMGGSWFSNNLNRAHLDYFYWILTALSAVQLVCYIYFSQSYVYKQKGNAPV